MQRWIAYVFMFVVATLAAYGQKLTQEQAAEYQRTFDKALTAHNAKRFDESIAGFTRCLELAPGDSTAMYNIACGYSLQKQLDPAFEWLKKSIDAGFVFGPSGGTQPDPLTLAEKSDTDLEAMRADPRWVACVETMKAQRKAVDEFVAEPAFYLPKACEGLVEVPLLVVLHADGATKNDIVAGVWKEVADELGYALLAPSAKSPEKIDPQLGMVWFNNPSHYAQYNYIYEKPVGTALDWFKKTRKYDKSRVVIAGEGVGGMVALHVALGSPFLYSGALSLGFPPLESIVSSKAANAAKSKLTLRILLSPDADTLGPDAKPADFEALAKQTQALLTSKGLKGEALCLPLVADGAQGKARLVEALRAILTPPAGAPAAGQ